MQPLMIRFVEVVPIQPLSLFIERWIEIIENLVACITELTNASDEILPIALVDKRNSISKCGNLRDPSCEAFNREAAGNTIVRRLLTSADRASSWAENA